LQEAGLKPEPREALARFLKIYDRRLMNHTVPYEGIAESLALAVRRGPLAVLTNKPLGPSIGLLEALGMRGFFSRIIGGDSEFGRKPDPAWPALAASPRANRSRS
jgi:phosphoglycolate phosphatase